MDTQTNVAIRIRPLTINDGPRKSLQHIPKDPPVSCFYIILNKNSTNCFMFKGPFY